MAIFLVENVFRTEGVPEFTFVRPPNYNDILVDIRNPGKPVIIEGQSGTGKTTTVRKIIEESIPDIGYQYFSARKPSDLPRIKQIASGNHPGRYIIDDFHRLETSIQKQIADIVKVAAEEYDNPLHPKIVIVGINKVGSELIHLVHDIAKRCGIHRIAPASREIFLELVHKGEEKLKISFLNKDQLFIETNGDYWLTQLVCQSICLFHNITQTSPTSRDLKFSVTAIRDKVTTRLEHAYQETVKEFCRGNRFRSTNDPYFKLLKTISEQDSSIVDLTELANSIPEVRGSINNIKERRLSSLIESKPICEKHFYYNRETKVFAIEDPALFYYLRHLNWEELRRMCGFRIEDKEFAFDFAISFAGENRVLAHTIASQIETLDCSVFYDEFFESNYLGKAWHSKFQQVFGEESRFVICLLDLNYLEKIWPTFERESFIPRVKEGAVIPIYLDSTTFPGIPRDTIGLVVQPPAINHPDFDNFVTDKITFKLMERIEAI